MQFLFSILMSIAPASSDLSSYASEFARAPQKSIRNLSGWKDRDPRQAASCLAGFKKYFQDGTLNITFSLGYHDWPLAGKTRDQESFRMVQQALTAPCQSNFDSVCGFSIVDQPWASALIFEKTLPNYPELEIQSPKIRIEMAYSSWSTVDAENFSGKMVRSEQSQLSSLNEDLFFGSIAGQERAPCDICIYMGHARNGGGPDFLPVPYEWSTESRKPIYSYYLKNRAGFKKLLSAIEKRTPEDSPLVAFLGCNSFKKFYSTKVKICRQSGNDCAQKSLSDYSEKMGFLLTDDLSWPANRSLYFAAALEGALSLKCRPEWNSNFNKVSEKSNPAENYRLIGNFL